MTTSKEIRPGKEEASLISTWLILLLTWLWQNSPGSPPFLTSQLHMGELRNKANSVICTVILHIHYPTVWYALILHIHYPTLWDALWCCYVSTLCPSSIFHQHWLTSEGSWWGVKSWPLSRYHDHGEDGGKVDETGQHLCQWQWGCKHWTSVMVGLVRRQFSVGPAVRAWKT